MKIKTLESMTYAELNQALNLAYEEKGRFRVEEIMIEIDERESHHTRKCLDLNDKLGESDCICPPLTPKHTPTPWHLSQTGKFVMHSRPGTIVNVLTVCECSEEDAAFIVRAVNAYEKDQETIVELLASLREYKEAAVNGSVVTIGMARRSAAAIAKAESSEVTK